ncbi:MAG: lipopolysaccharide biosynthesis protein [Prevotellaceae bacterium]|jgi:O-antigen/teichoic acid export membrane protein|nr:lipopolysaccharide biosynthesis protein [Prevotellaceae bacterium]
MERKTSMSLVWSSADKFGVQLLAMLVGVFTARMLSSADFGIIACLAIFTAIANVLIDSGFSAALIRREKNTNSEYCAAFLFNLIFSVLLYFVLYFSSGKIAQYYNIPQLVSLSRFVFIAVVINSLGIIQNIIFTREMKFKEISIANLVSAVVSAVVTVILVLSGYTFWAIAWQQITLVAVRVAVMWALSNWKPIYKPDFSVLIKLFSFSALLLLTSIVNIFGKNIYALKIPVKFGTTNFGYYDRARKFQEIPAGVVAGALSSVAYPVLSSLNNEPDKQKQFFRKMVRINAFLIFPVMLGLIGIIENMTVIVLTEKWLPMIDYFRILCATAIFMPFQSLCLTTFNAIGKAKYNFALELGRNLLIITLFFLFSENVTQMLLGYTTAMFCAYICDIIFVGKFIKYSLSEHLRDILPYAVISAAMCILVLIIGNFFARWHINIYLIFAAQCLLGAGFYIGTARLLGSQVIRDVFDLFRKKNG